MTNNIADLHRFDNTMLDPTMVIVAGVTSEEFVTTSPYGDERCFDYAVVVIVQAHQCNPCWTTLIENVTEEEAVKVLDRFQKWLQNHE